MFLDSVQAVFLRLTFKISFHSFKEIYQNNFFLALGMTDKENWK